MPLMFSDALPQRKSKYGRFLVASLAFHALLLGLGELDFQQGLELRFHSLERSLSVDLIAPGVPEERPEGETVAAPSSEPVTVQEVEKSHPAPAQTRKVERKKQVAPAKRRAEPKEEPSTAPNQPADHMGMPAEKASFPHSKGAGERTIGDVGAPAFARFVPPEYPHQARARNLEGRVVLRVLVSAEGRAREIEVLESSHPDFTRAARKSVQRSRYVPLERQGRAEEVWVLIPFQFTLK